MKQLTHLTSEERKQHPAFSGCIAYFPDAIMAISNHSWKANEKHNPGETLYWNRAKSGDELDALQRHVIDYARGERYDSDGLQIAVAIAWRALAFLQKELEKEQDSSNSGCVMSGYLNNKPIYQTVTLNEKDMELYNMIQEHNNGVAF